MRSRLSGGVAGVGLGSPGPPLCRSRLSPRSCTSLGGRTLGASRAYLPGRVTRVSPWARHARIALGASRASLSRGPNPRRDGKRLAPSTPQWRSDSICGERARGSGVKGSHTSVRPRSLAARVRRAATRQQRERRDPRSAPRVFVAKKPRLRATPRLYVAKNARCDPQPATSSQKSFRAERSARSCCREAALHSAARVLRVKIAASGADAGYCVPVPPPPFELLSSGLSTRPGRLTLGRTFAA